MEPATYPARKKGVLFLASLVALGLCTAFLLALARFHEDLAHPFLEHFDRSILEGIHAHDVPGLTALARLLSFIGSPRTLVPAVPVAAAVAWRKGHRHDAVLLLLSMAGAGVLESAIKLHYRRVRPEVPWAFVHERSFSFPSGHSVLAAVLYGVLGYLALRHLRRAGERAMILLGCLTLVAGIGLSRIYLGAHYPSDVLAGYFVGSTWLMFVLGGDWVLRRRDG